MNTYKVEVVRDGRWWMVHVPEIDDFTQARRVGEIELMARELIAVNTGTPLDDVAVTVVSIDLGGVDILRDAAFVKNLRAEAGQAEYEAVSNARQYAKSLTKAGIPVRDIAELLAISPQRISQLTNLKPGPK